MFRTRGYKYELRVNNKEQTLLAKCAGISRFAWNWGLAARKTRYQNQTGDARFTDAMKQRKELNRLKHTYFPWMYEVSKCVPEEALRDLDRAYQNFFINHRKRKRKQTSRFVGLPKFKKKGKSKDSFRLAGTIHLFPKVKKVQLPRLGKLRLKEKPILPTSARILSVTVSRTADRWFPSSKLCSNCLYYHHDLTLTVRVFHCPLCGLILDRDQNAAFNIANYYTIYQFLLFPVAESSAETLNACGEAVRPAFLQARVVESGRTAP